MVVSVAHDGDHELVDEHGQLVDTGLLDELVDDLEAGGGRRGDRAAGEGRPGRHSVLITMLGEHWIIPATGVDHKG